MRKTNSIFAAAITLLVVALQGCGGGGGTPGASAPQTLGGTVAVGDPIVGATVNVACATGPALSTITSAQGAWQVTLGTQTFPCAAQASSGNLGTATGSANTTPYHSLATAAGVMNITPLTDLLVANLSGTASLASWFNGLSSITWASVTQAAITNALTQVRTALALSQLATVNPVTSAFNPVAGNVMDDLLSSLQTALTGQSISFATLQNAAAQSTFNLPGGLAAAYSAAYASSVSGAAGTGGTGGGGSGGGTSAAPTARGTVTVTGPDASFSPDAAGFSVEVNADSTKYNFTYQANTINNQSITIDVPRAGNTRRDTTVAFLAGASSSLFYTCTSNCGVTVSQPDGATHPVTITLTNTPLARATSPTVVVRTLSGSLIGDTGGALWQSSELPRTTTGTLTLGAITQTVHTSSYTETSVNANVIRSATFTLKDGSVASLSRTDSGPVSVTHTNGVTILICNGNTTNCNATLSNAGSTVTATFTNTPLGTTTLTGTVTIGATSGSVTTTAQGTFTPVSDSIESANNTRTYTYSNFGAGNGITMVTATLRDGVATSVTMAFGVGGAQRYCFETASSILGAPACTGVTLGNDGRSITFTATNLGSGANQTVINGTLTAKGL